MKKFIHLVLALAVTSRLGAQTYFLPVPSGTQKRLMTVSFGSNLTGYIGGADSLLLKTTDGGLTWTRPAYSGIAFSAAAQDIVHVNFVSATTGFAIAGNFANPEFQGVLYKTTDGGANWVSVQAGTIAALRSFFFDAQNGFLIGSAFFAGKTVVKLNNGSWASPKNLGNGSQNFLRAIDFRTPAIGITGGDEGQVYRTFNGGATWDTVQTNTTARIYALRFTNPRTILAAVDEPAGSLLISHDTGRTWQTDLNSLTFFYPVLKSIVLSAKDSFVAVGKSNNDNTGVILYHTPQFSVADGAPQPLHEVARRDDSVVFAVGDSGLIMTNAKAALSAVNPGATGSVMAYPDPFSASFRTSAASLHWISVIDVSGKVVYADRETRREHTVNLPGRPAGLYIVEMHFPGGVVQRRKMCKL